MQRRKGGGHNKRAREEVEAVQPYTWMLYIIMLLSNLEHWSWRFGSDILRVDISGVDILRVDILRLTHKFTAMANYNPTLCCL